MYCHLSSILLLYFLNEIHHSYGFAIIFLFPTVYSVGQEGMPLFFFLFAVINISKLLCYLLFVFLNYKVNPGDQFTLSSRATGIKNVISSMEKSGHGRAFWRTLYNR